MSRKQKWIARRALLMTFMGAIVLVLPSTNASNSADLNPAACSIPNFNGPTKITLSSPRAIVVSDFNKDGKPDIATASHFSNNVSILLGNGTGGFSGPTNFALQGAVASHPIFLVSADLNGDGNADLVAANEDGNRAVSVLLGNGTGGFGAASSFITVTQAKTSSVALGDVNGDNKLDLAVTNADPFSQRIIVATGDGTGQFTFLRNLSSGGFPPNHVVMRDINGDNKTDLVVANGAATAQTPGTVGVLLGDGAGNFSAATTFAVGIGPVSIAVEDFSGDGKLDLAVANQGSNNMSVLLGNGAGSFNPPATYDARGTGPQSVVPADFNGDGKVDLALSNTRPGSAVIFMGDGAGGFTASANFSTGGPLFIGSDLNPAAVADFNGDGRSDLAFANESQGAASVLLNDCGSSSAAQFQLNNSSYSVNENDGSTSATNSLYIVSVTRTGDITGTASVDYATTNDTALSPQDYTASSGTLNFAPGETFKTLSIPLTNDEIPEDAEAFNLTLSNVMGAASLSDPATASISIVDDDLAFVQFSSSDANLSEAAGSPGVVVTRSGNMAGAGTVNYATSDTAGASNCNVVNHVASSRCDYITTVGTLHFAPGETSKSISIPVIDDSYAEGGEGLTLTLSNPTGIGFRIGGATFKSVSIIDNDTVNGTNPIDASSFFVRQHYIDFLNREPDTSGLNFWIGEIENCTPKPQCTEIKRINVSAAFFLSIEFQETGYLVERIYKASYGDGSGLSTLGGAHQLTVPIIRLNEFLPDTQEIGQGVVVNQGNWQQQLEDNKKAFTAEFVRRSRFTTAFPVSMTAAQFVDKLNANAGNPLSTAERDQLVTDLSTSAKTRAQVLRAVAEDPDLNSAESNRAFVLMQYFGYLRRNPNDPQDTDYTGYDFWLTKLNQFNGNFVNAEMVKAFLLSGEYRQRFGP
jgi:hypothetical protein